MSCQCSKCNKENDKFTTKDLYTELFHCRDFELQHYWQRSVFLAGFMIALFTLYGSFVGDNLSLEINNEIHNSANINVNISKNIEPISNLFTKSKIHYFGFLIGCVGIIISQLFIMMIKGSKRWYEQFEQSIYWFYYNDTDLFSKELNKNLEDYLEDKKYPHFGGLKNIKKDRINNSLLNTNAGYYSVSRINIVLGQLLCLVWMGIIGFHLFNILYSFEFITEYFDNEKYICDFFIFVSTVFVVFLLVWLFSLVLKKFVISKD